MRCVRPAVVACRATERSGRRPVASIQRLRWATRAHKSRVRRPARYIAKPPLNRKCYEIRVRLPAWGIFHPRRVVVSVSNSYQPPKVLTGRNAASRRMRAAEHRSRLSAVGIILTTRSLTGQTQLLHSMQAAGHRSKHKSAGITRLYLTVSRDVFWVSCITWAGLLPLGLTVTSSLSSALQFASTTPPLPGERE